VPKQTVVWPARTYFFYPCTPLGKRSTGFRALIILQYNIINRAVRLTYDITVGLGAVVAAVHLCYDPQSYHG